MKIDEEAKRLLVGGDCLSCKWFITELDSHMNDPAIELFSCEKNKFNRYRTSPVIGGCRKYKPGKTKRFAQSSGGYTP